MNDFKETLNNIDQKILIKIPEMIDAADRGKSIIHKCAQFRTYPILNYTLETYLEVYTCYVLKEKF